MICAACFAKFAKGDIFVDLEEIWLHQSCAEELIFEALACADISRPDYDLFASRVPNCWERIKLLAFAYWRVKLARGDYHQ